MSALGVCEECGTETRVAYDLLSALVCSDCAVTAVSTCRHCHREIALTQADGWVDPHAIGDDSVWRETCDSHDTFTPLHEPA